MAMYAPASSGDDLNLKDALAFIERVAPTMPQSVMTIRRLRKKGALRFKKRGHFVFFNRGELRADIAEMGWPVSEE